jgi:hypothetical protein
LEKLWDRNIAITTRLVDTVTTPMLLKTVQSHRIDPKKLITHRFKLANILDAYETFGAAIGSAKDGKVTAFIPTPNAEIATPEGVGFDDAGNVYGSWTGKMAVRRWTKS